MDNAVVISIIIPVFNGEKYLEQCINSILSQSYKNYEIIIINDGSVDKTEIIAKNFEKQHSKVRYFYQNNIGVSEARNRGLHLANGEYIMFVDADDYISGEYLNNFAKHLLKGYDIIIGGITKISTDINTSVTLPQKGVFSMQDILKDFAVQQSKNGIFGFVCSKLVKKSIIEDRKIRFDLHLSLAEDFDFFLKYYNYCETFLIIEECGYHYRQSIKHDKIDYLSQIAVNERLELFLVKNSLNNDFFTSENKVIIDEKYSDLKFAYFSELKDISVKNVKIGLVELQNIKWGKPKSLTRNIIKILAEIKLVSLLTTFLLLRKKYVNLKRKWS